MMSFTPTACVLLLYAEDLFPLGWGWCGCLSSVAALLMNGGGPFSSAQPYCAVCWQWAARCQAPAGLLVANACPVCVCSQPVLFQISCDCGGWWPVLEAWKAHRSWLRAACRAPASRTETQQVYHGQEFGTS